MVEGGQRSQAIWRILVVCWLCLAGSLLTSGALWTSRWRERADLGGKLPSDHLPQLPVSRKVECAAFAATPDLQGAAFTFDPNTGQCYVHQSQWPYVGTDLPGAVTFHRVSSQCPGDWHLVGGSLCLNASSTALTWEDARAW